jgi:hypothetical protein
MHDSNCKPLTNRHNIHLVFRGATVTPRFSNGTLTSRPLSSFSSGLVVCTGGTVGRGNGGGLLVVGTTMFCVPGAFCTGVVVAGTFITLLLLLFCGAFWMRTEGTTVVLVGGTVDCTFWPVGGAIAIGALLRISTKENRLSTKRIPRNNDSITSAGFSLEVLLCLAIFKYYS